MSAADPVAAPAATAPVTAASGAATSGRRTRARALALGLAPALVLLAVALWEIRATTRAGADVPDDEAWRDAAAAIRAQHQPGDLLVVAPAWLDPVLRLHLGDLIPIDAAARMDAARYGTIWELSARGARADETRGLSPVSTTRYDGLTVRRFVRTPAQVVTDVRDQLRAFAVTGARAGGPSLELAEVGFTPRRCVQVIPAPGGSVRLELAEVELGRELVGYVGLADVFTRRDVRAPGRLAVEVDGQEVASITVGVDDGWRRFAAATTPGRHRLAFVATAVGAGARDRRICFAAEARR